MARDSLDASFSERRIMQNVETIPGSLNEWASTVFDAARDPGWTLHVDGYDPVLEREVESRFTVSNGFLGVRASLERPTLASRPRTYVAGLFDVAPEGPAIPALVPGPDWLRLIIRIDGQELSPEDGEILAHTRTLDLRSGVLIGDWQHRLPLGQVVRLRTLRLASLVQRSIALQLAQLECAQVAEVTIEAMLVPVSPALTLEWSERDMTRWRTMPGGRSVVATTKHQIDLNGRTLDEAKTNDLTATRWTLRSGPSEVATFARTVVFTRNGQQPGSEAGSRDHAMPGGPNSILTSHTNAWVDRWSVGGISIDCDAHAQEALRFAVYHLVSAANPDDEQISVGARALTGDAYLGHVFWDTEIFLVPFYALTWPEAARAMLMYRYHTLSAARSKAARFGYRGALYAWESADTGEETTPEFAIAPDGEVVPILSGVQEHHISSAVAYAVWQYWAVTGDAGFLVKAGAEILFETARFWASRASLESDGRRHIRGVIGPDEYHDSVDDNAYTNVMAQWNLERAFEVAELLKTRWPDRWAEIKDRLEITEHELALWHEVAATLVTGLDTSVGLIEQFEGFFQLEPVDLSSYEPRTVAMDVLLGRERTQRSQVIKQADVVMLLALLWDRFPPNVREANFRYYEPRTGHGSSLSPAIHSLIAARLGHLDLAKRYFQEAASIDLGNTMTNVAGGVHIATLGGLWQAAVFGFAGLHFRPDGIGLDPHLPESWNAMSFVIRWQGRVVQLHLSREPPTVRANLAQGRRMTVHLGSLRSVLSRGQPCVIGFDAAAEEWKGG
jgi:trehalose/maltose hydrolase-like predicted phosphorylase